ncbi:MCM2/3/5 family-domain-containing protein [Mycena filopes]|nr:MCM2/3/5 family-domain-containing protein [Mycena filopes]
MELDGIHFPLLHRVTLGYNDVFRDLPTFPSHSLQPHSQQNAQRPATNALSLEDDDDPEAQEDGEAGGARPRRRPRTQATDVPLVKDAIGESVTDTFENFLKTFTNGVALAATPGSEHDMPGELNGERTYMVQIETMCDSELTTLYVDYTHRRALVNCVAELHPEYLKINPSSANIDSANLQSRDFNVAFYGLTKIGTLMSISGTVTRTSEVRPELLSGSFVCEACSGFVDEIEQQVQIHRVQPALCPNPTCGNRTAWKLQIDTSRFTDWQKVRIQENPSEIPTGSMPRSLDVILRSELVERAKAGDKCVFTGTFIVVPDVSQLGLPGGNAAQLQRESNKGGGGAAAGIGGGVTGLKSLGVRDLQYKTAFLACMVRDSDTRDGTNIRGEIELGEDNRQTFIESLTGPEFDELKFMIDEAKNGMYTRLVASIAPTVYGHEIVKKGLLLQLMGGVHKQTAEGMNLRGDINVCIVGDPSTSKSQFLKYVCSFLPRAVYTSGKASSAAGLTAAVMDISDQVAIHEAMEQQTISIAKAGIHATLNARTSILAAANPVGGRYDRKKSLHANVQMSQPIMSRFDLATEKTDMNIAQHIVNVHRFQNEAINPEFSTETLQRYIRYARTFNPKLTPEAADLLVEKYRLLRQDDATGAGRNSYRITVRQLESLIRLSEAIARANCTSDIQPDYVREAYSLLRQSIIHVDQDDIDFDEEELKGERGDARPRATSKEGDDNDGDGDIEMSQAEMDAMDEMEGSSLPAAQQQQRQPTVDPSESDPANANATDAPAPAPKRRMIITHDKYMTLQTGERGAGSTGTTWIDWYLEEKESEMQDTSDADYERELMTKMLRKLVKDNYLLEVKGDVQDSLPSMDEESQPVEGENVKVYYLVHPAVDTEGSSMTSTL